MTAAVLDRPATRAPGAPAAAALALARIEAVRLVRHPVVLVATAVLVGTWIYSTVSGGDRYPILQDADRGTHLGITFLIGSAGLIAANLAVLREHRHGTEPALRVLVLAPWWRTAAHLLALLPLVLLAAVLVGARIGILAAAPYAVGRPNVFELAAGPAAVLVLGALGVLLGRLIRSVVVAPLAVLAVLVVTFTPAAAVNERLARLGRLTLLQFPFSLEAPLPAEVMDRPAGRHLLYLLSLSALIVVLALAASRVLGPRLITCGVVAVGLVVASGAAQFVGPGPEHRAARQAATEHPATMLVCERRATVTYCAFRDFRRWIGAWDEVVRGVQRRVPPAVAGQPLYLRQRLAAAQSIDGGVMEAGPPAEMPGWLADDLAAGTPNALSVSTTWGDGSSEVGLAGRVAFELMTRSGPAAYGPICRSRGALAIWLVGQATPETAAGLRKVDSTSWGAIGFSDFSMPGSHLMVPDRDVALGLVMLRRPADEMGARVLAAWDELTASATTLQRAAELLGLPAPPPEEPDGAEWRCS